MQQMTITIVFSGSQSHSRQQQGGQWNNNPEPKAVAAIFSSRLTLILRCSLVQALKQYRSAGSCSSAQGFHLKMHVAL